MKRYNLDDLEENYDLEFDKVLSKIKKIKKKNSVVLLQFPDGLKPYANSVVDFLKDKLKKEKNKAEFLIWMESCYGACDTPVIGKNLDKKIDLMIQFGHNELMPRKS